MYNAYMKCFNLSLAMLSAILFTVPVVAVERVSLERDGKSIHVDGRIVVEAADGGLLLQDDNGVLWAITPDEIVSRDSDAFPFEPLDKDAIGDDLITTGTAASQVLNSATELEGQASALKLRVEAFLGQIRAE